MDLMDRSRTVTRLRRLADPEEDAYVAGLTPGERMALVWPLTLQAWGFAEGTTGEPRLRRDVVRVVRRLNGGERKCREEVS
jgi:hypothetical protein